MAEEISTSMTSFLQEYRDSPMNLINKEEVEGSFIETLTDSKNNEVADADGDIFPTQKNENRTIAGSRFLMKMTNQIQSSMKCESKALSATKKREGSATNGRKKRGTTVGGRVLNNLYKVAQAASTSKNSIVGDSSLTSSKTQEAQETLDSRDSTIAQSCTPSSIIQDTIQSLIMNQEASQQQET